jgi:hypothetical protein
MRTIDSTRPHPATTQSADGRSVRREGAPTRRPSPQHIADAVTAGYIYDISHAKRPVPAGGPGDS